MRNSFYIKVKHPVTGEQIAVVPTGKLEDHKAECLVITPKSNLDKVWIERNDILPPDSKAGENSIEGKRNGCIVGA